MNPAPVITVDCMYQRPRHAAVYIMIENGRAVIIDTNTANAIPRILDALARYGLDASAIDYIIPTHLHLDHAGGASQLALMCPRARVISHPRGVRHYADPARLIAGVKAVYGDEPFQRLFPGIVPIPPGQIQAVTDGEQLVFGARTLTFLHTPGHAYHHICIHDSLSGGIFTGDTFGVEYLPGRRGRLPFLLCSSAPADFDPAAARASIARLMALQPRRLYLAHFGELPDVAGAADALRHSLDAMERIMIAARDAACEGPALQMFCLQQVRNALTAQTAYCGVTLQPAETEAMDSHLEINAQGLAHAALKARNPRPPE